MEIGKTFCGRTYGHTWVPVYKVIGRRWPKNGTTIFAYNFVKCQPIFKILSLTDLALNLLTPRTSWPDRFFWASPFFGFSFFIILFCSVPCGRLSWLLVSFWAHVNVVNRIVSYRKQTTTLTLNHTASKIVSIHMAGRVNTADCVYTFTFFQYAFLLRATLVWNALEWSRWGRFIGPNLLWPSHFAACTVHHVNTFSPFLSAPAPRTLIAITNHHHHTSSVVLQRTLLLIFPYADPDVEAPFSD